jgi:predicted MFS family arabinose efflux permease
MLTIFTWREVLVMNVVPGVVMAILIMIYLGRVHTADKKNETKKPGEQRLKGRAYFAAFGELLKSRAVLLLSLSSSCRALTMSALMAFLPLYLANYMGYSATAVGVALFVMQGAGFAAAPIAGHLSDKMGRRQIIMSSFSVTAVVILGMIFAGGTELFVYMVALLGFFLFSIRAVLQAWLLDATPSNMGGSAIGIMFGMQAAGQAIGPYCAGVLADTFGIMSAFYFLAATIVIANFFVFFTPVTKEEAKA